MSLWSEKMVEASIKRYVPISDKWRYEYGVYLKGVELLWKKTNREKYFGYLKESVDRYIQPDGTIETYKQTEYNIDNVNSGKVLFALYEQTKDDRYKKATESLIEQLENHPRTSEGGLWHKKIYPHQIWLDGVYMAQPFYAQYANVFSFEKGYSEALHEIILVEKHLKDEKTGLYYHGWDESKEQKWANSQTGLSSHFWGRGMGWFVMAIVDVLDYIPKDYQDRDKVIEIFKNAIDALVKVVDPQTGLWYQLLNYTAINGNYLEASASCMITYAIAKAVRMGYIETSYIDIAKKAYKGILENFITEDEYGICLDRNCSVAGLGGNPYRDGSFEYYMSEPIVQNDKKGVGAFIMASIELE